MPLILLFLALKGGVGKSTCCSLAIEFLRASGIDPVLFECDPSNPDVGKTYGGILKMETALMRDDDLFENWSWFLSTVREKSQKQVVVINTPAGILDDIRSRGELLNELDGLVTIWPIDTDIDCVELLDEYVRIVKKPICVVKNGHHGKRPDLFDVFDEYAAKHGVPSVFLPPSSPPSVVHTMRSKRCPLPEVWDKIPHFDKIVGQQWASRALKSIEYAISKVSVVDVG